MKDAFVGDFTDATVTASDYFIHGDATDSGNTKKDTIQGILDLAGGGITIATEQATTSGSDFTFSGIASGTKRVYMIFEEVVISGSDDWLIQLGDGGGIETSGYTSSSTSHTPANVIASATSTSGFVMDNNSGSSSTLTGAFCFELTDSTNNTWIGHSVLESHTNQMITSGGSKSLSAELTQIKLDTTGSNTFSAGSVNITYE